MIQISCCIGECRHILQLKPRLLTEHVKKYHPQAYEQLNCDYIYYCNNCDTFTTYMHYHCSNCEVHFKSKNDLDHHFACYHKLWFLENDCIYAQDCKKKVCKYTHYMYDKNYFVENKDFIPASVCDYDLPWIGIRCNKRDCTKDHFMGRK